MSHRRHAGRALASIVLLAVAAMASAGPAGAASHAITEFSIRSANNQPGDMTVGADDNVWFIDQFTNKIGHITKTGTISGSVIPTLSSNPIGIAAGPDGGVWFTEAKANKIGRINSASKFGVETFLGAGKSPRGITAGPDGNLYFVEYTPGTVNMINPTSRALTTVATLQAGAGPTRITSGPDGNLWITETAKNAVAKVTIPGHVKTEIALPAGAAPSRIASGPDGNIWVAEPGTNHVARISPAGGILNQFPVGGKPTGITAGPDGNMWVTEQTGNNIARITPTGTVTAFPITTKNSSPGGIVVGGDGNVWFSENAGNKIGRLIAAPGHSSFVIVHDGSFVPATQGIALATGTAKKPTTVRWQFESGGSHSVTDSSLTGLFDSGAMAPGTSFSHLFTTAGRFPYSSTVGTDTQAGVITVTPKAVVNGANIDITVATSYPLGVTTNIQVKVPNAGSFVPAPGGTGVSTNTFSFTPANGHGTYRFQVATAANGHTTGWSPTISIIF